jgi:hypothetical protein
VFTPTRANPRISEEGESDDDEEFNPPLIQEGLNPTFDGIISPPSPRKGKGAASASSSYSDADTLGTTTRNYILEQQADQKEQLRKLFSLVSTLGEEIRTVVRTVGNNPSSNSAAESTAGDQNQSDPTQKKKGKKVAFGGPPLEQEEEEGLDDNNDDHDDDAAGTIAVDGYVSHAYYRELISEGFEKRAPSRQAPSKPAYYPIDDPSTPLST